MLTLNQIQVIMPILPPETAAEYLPHLNAAMEEFGITTPAHQAAFLAQLAHESGQLRYMEEWDHKHYLAGCRECERQRASGMDKDSIGHAAGVQYENRRDLGNNQPGDGVRFKGRGPIMLTGRANYAAASRALYPGAWACRGCGLGFCAATPPSQPHCGSGVWETFLERHADHVLLPEVGFRVAGWFWATTLDYYSNRHGVALNVHAERCDRLYRNGKLDSARAGFALITRAINGGLNGDDERWAYYLRAREVLT